MGAVGAMAVAVRVVSATATIPAAHPAGLGKALQARQAAVQGKTVVLVVLMRAVEEEGATPCRVPIRRAPVALVILAALAVLAEGRGKSTVQRADGRRVGEERGKE